SARPALTDRVQRRGDLGRMVAVVVDEGETADRSVDVAVLLQTPVDAMERAERARDRLVRRLQLARYSERGQGVQHVVYARQVELHAQRLQAAGTLNVEMCVHAAALDVDGPHIGVLGLDAVRDDRPRYARREAARRRIIR